MLPDLTGVYYQKTGLPAAFSYPCALALWRPFPPWSYGAPRLLCTPRQREGAGRIVNVMNWDHCHLHGLIRGPLCTYHNHLMAMFDRGARAYRNDPTLTAYAGRCWRCARRGNSPKPDGGVR
jgi:hypothetical protein